MSPRVRAWLAGGTWTVVASAAVVAVGFGCESSHAAQAPRVATAAVNAAVAPAPAPATPAQLSTPCVLGVPAAHARAVDTDDGVDVVLTAPSARLDELRRRAYETAREHGPGAEMGVGHGGRHRQGDDHGLKLHQLPPLVTPKLTTTADGATMHLAPEDPSQRADVRARVHERVAAIEDACGQPR